MWQVILFSLWFVCSISAPVQLRPGTWSADSATSLSSTFTYQSVGEVVDIEVLRTSTLNKTSTQAVSVWFNVKAQGSGKVWEQNKNVKLISDGIAGETYEIVVEAETGMPSFTYVVRACEGTCESGSLKKCWTNETFCNGNGACKVARGVCACDYIDWQTELESLPGYLKGVAKLLGEADTFLNQFISDQCSALDPAVVVEYLSHYFVIICVVSVIVVILAIGITVGLCCCFCSCCKFKKGPLTGIYQPVDRFEADELEGFPDSY